MKKKKIELCRFNLRPELIYFLEAVSGGRLTCCGRGSSSGGGGGDPDIIFNIIGIVGLVVLGIVAYGLLTSLISWIGRVIS